MSTREERIEAMARASHKNDRSRSFDPKDGFAWDDLPEPYLVMWRSNAAAAYDALFAMGAIADEPTPEQKD